MENDTQQNLSTVALDIERLPLSDNPPSTANSRTHSDRQKRNLLILAEHLNGDSDAVLADRYNLSRRHIRSILRPSTGKKRSTNGMEIDEQNRRDRDILFAHLSGKNTKTIADQFGMRVSAISEILRKQGRDRTKEIALRDEQVSAFFAEGLGRKAIAGKMNLSINVVGYIFAKYGFVWKAQEKTCQHCGSAYTAAKYNQKYCSPKCYREQHSEYQREREGMGTWKKCEFCDKTYKTRRFSDKYTQRFCGNSCAAKARSPNNDVRDNEIFYLRHVQELSFKRIEELFDLSNSRVRRIFGEQQEIRSLRLSELQAGGKS